MTNFGVTYSAVRVRRRSSATSQVTTEKALNISADVSSSVLSKPADQGSREATTTPADAQSSALTRPTEHGSSEAKANAGSPIGRGGGDRYI